MLMRVLIAFCVALLTLSPLLTPDTGDAKKKKRYKTVTRAVFPNYPISDFTIPAQGNVIPYPIEFVPVSGLKKGKIRDVNLNFFYCHDNPDDLDMLLVAPNGDNALVMSDAGGSLFVEANLVLDDEATAPLPDSEPIGATDGPSPCGPFLPVSFRPANYTPIGNSDDFPGAPAPSGAVALSTFDGGNPNGIWRLYVRDDFTGDGGEMLLLALEITARVKKKK